MKKVFSSNSDIYKNAYMNWRTDKYQPIHNLNVLAEGYFDSAKLSIKACLVDNSDHKADGLIFPILFSINHGIELYEKSICWSLNVLLGHNSKFPDNHYIREIWYTVKRKIEEFGFDYGREEVDFSKMIVPLEKYLDEIYRNIMTSNLNDARYNIDFSRFPSNRNLRNHFYVNQYDNVVIDLENLLERCAALNNCLSSLAETYYDLVLKKWDEQQEMK